MSYEAESRADPGLRPSVWMLGGAAAFATMGALTHAVGAQCGWVVIALVRAGFMLFSSALLARAAGVRLRVFDPPTLWIRSIAGSISLFCNFYALTRLPVADAITLSNTYPLWIVVLSALELRRLPNGIEALGVLCGIVGVVLIEQPHLEGDRFAAFLALASAIFTAVAMLGLHRLRGIDPRAIVVHFAGVASAALVVWMALGGSGVSGSVVDGPALGLLIGVGATGTVGQILLTKAYAAGPPTRVSVVGLTQVIFALGYDILLWGRTLTPLTIAGFVLVLAPSAVLAGRGYRQLLKS